MSRDSASKIHIKAFDDLFGGGEVDNTNSEELLKDAVEIPLDELHPFKNHPFIVRDDDKLQEMVESIKNVGILNPGIVRKDPNGGYEIISGHTRKEAALRAGLTTMPVIIRDYDDDLATIAMVDSNLQREEIKISEKAKAYAMKYEAMKHQGSNGGLTLKAMSEETGEGYKSIQRLVKLSSLSDELLKMIDDKKLGVRHGVDLSELSSEEQRIVYQVLSDNEIKMSMNQASDIKEAGKSGTLDEETVKRILESKEMNSEKKQTARIKAKGITADDIYKYFADTGTLTYNNDHDCYGIKRDGEWFNESLNGGDYVSIFIKGRWIDTRIDKNDEGWWYLAETDIVGTLDNIIVKC